MFTNSQTRTLHGSEETETRGQGSDSLQRDQSTHVERVLVETVSGFESDSDQECPNSASARLPVVGLWV
jgi:hypothetical protein